MFTIDSYMSTENLMTVPTVFVVFWENLKSVPGIYESSKKQLLSAMLLSWKAEYSIEAFFWFQLWYYRDKREKLRQIKLVLKRTIGILQNEY